MPNRHKDALQIQQGASNPLAVANALVCAIREVNDERGSARTDAAVLLIAHQLEHLLRSKTLSESLQVYQSALKACQDAAK
jgi:hypothetical protein